ncbi:MAG TPA: MFS transporter [Candidatus Saccharimonadales bacterium]|nr:MFS transporter [Candidatus Saccharimonadales bacterium]
MKKWTVVILLGMAQFVMVLDSTVMNVSISTVVADLHTSVTALQAAITFYTLTMAAFMLLGGKLGDVWGRKRAFTIGAIIYALGSFITAISPNIATLFIGWSVIEGLGAVLVIPAIAALVASNYHGKDRMVAYAIIGAVSGAAAAAGPLIGGYVTTYLSWRYVFVAEVFIMAIILLFGSKIADALGAIKTKIDVPSVLLSASGLFFLVFGMLQSKTWGWVQPRAIPTVGGHEIAPLGISLVAYLILVGILILYWFFNRQRMLEQSNRNPLLKTSMLSIKRLRSGLGVLAAQYMITASVFFVIPVYLQMTLGLDALQTGIKILPLSIAVILCSIVGTRLSSKWPPKKIVRTGQFLLVIGALTLVGSVATELKSGFFLVGMFLVGSGLGLLASQLGNINMSSVDESQSAEVGGLQGVFQNLGSSFGTALIGSILVATLTTAFVANVNTSTLPSNVKTYVNENSQAGVAIVSTKDVSNFAQSQGLSEEDVNAVTDAYASSQIEALRTSLFAVAVLAILTLAFSRNIPTEIKT